MLEYSYFILAIREREREKIKWSKNSFYQGAKKFIKGGFSENLTCSLSFLQRNGSYVSTVFLNLLKELERLKLTGLSVSCTVFISIEITSN